MFDNVVYTWYTTTVNKEEVPLLTLWHEQIGLIQVSKQGQALFFCVRRISSDAFFGFGETQTKALVDTVYLGGA